MIEHLVGMQAQIPTNPYLGLWSRLDAFEPVELERLLLERLAVRMVLMRGTIHLVSTDDALALRPVMQPVLDAELFKNRTWSVGLQGVDLAPVLELGRRMVEERPRPMSELRAAIAERWPERDATTLAYACRNQLPTFQVPPRGLWHRSGQVALTTIDHWSGRPIATETAPDATILRYLAAFGPASTGDVAAWSRLQGMRGPMERLRPRLRTFRDERGRELFDLPEAPIADPDLPGARAPAARLRQRAAGARRPQPRDPASRSGRTRGASSAARRSWSTGSPPGSGRRPEGPAPAP